MNPETSLSIVSFDGEDFFKINNNDAIRPFFMSIVSSSNHWMFIASNGGLTAGRKNADHSLFPYYTDDKITESAEQTGSKTIIRYNSKEKKGIWEPFSIRNFNTFKTTRNLYKNIYGHKILFEEINHELQIIFRYKWCSSEVFGFVRYAEIINNSSIDYELEIVDGIQNILPFGVPSDLQNSSSNLVDAYKRCELHHPSGLGIYSLSAIIADKAEPSEALKANIIWSAGCNNPIHLLSGLQLDSFREGRKIEEETDIRGEKGAYFTFSKITIYPSGKTKWKIIANVNQSQSQIKLLIHTLAKHPDIEDLIEQDIQSGTNHLLKLAAAADGIQFTSDKLSDVRHYSNTLFNIMRGGIFDNNYQIEKKDFLTYLQQSNHNLLKKHSEIINNLQDLFTYFQLTGEIKQTEDPDLYRLCTEYLPLTFSRRHGDPSRPWNKFSINTQSEIDGSKILDYQGNWRDIFQNWEALAHAYPYFIDGMIFKFLNASTFDGYNPYRITKNGFDWETIEPDNSWSYIGYWGDHQIIYLLKLLEFAEDYFPGKILSYLDKRIFVYAAVPYTIKPYEEIIKNPKDTIRFEHAWDKEIRLTRLKKGSDGALLTAHNSDLHHVTFLEKIMATLLAKISNFIPGGGIWMNTQRPEWNDANNALVGNGVSMVTLYYLHRFIAFFKFLLENINEKDVHISAELLEYFDTTNQIISGALALPENDIDNVARKNITDQLGKSASDYRIRIYKQGFSGETVSLNIKRFRYFLEQVLICIQNTIRKSKRSDGLYHAYNLVTITKDEMIIDHLNEMLEGQVAVLSSGYLSAGESLDILRTLRKSTLYRQDQFSYILYPNKDLPGFLQKNTIPTINVQSSSLLKRLIKDTNTTLVEKDIEGVIHFNGNFKNVNDVNKALDYLLNSEYKDLVISDRTKIEEIFEQVFNHKAFTGRSGTFFAYEGLGSIYWHMVSKLLLAVQECFFSAVEKNERPQTIKNLQDIYYEIKEGIGIHKPPHKYGAFPTDPYSHTPLHKGAQQPGMTGQVKEDILARNKELGIFVVKGQYVFNPRLLQDYQWISEPEVIKFNDILHEELNISLEKDSIFFTICQVPVILKKAENNRIIVTKKNHNETTIDGNILSEDISNTIFRRTGEIEKITVHIKP